jgi:hypothetical protein
MRGVPKWPGMLEHGGRDTQKDPDRPGKKGCRRCWRKDELNRIRVIAQNYKRYWWKEELNRIRDSSRLLEMENSL